MAPGSRPPPRLSILCPLPRCRTAHVPAMRCPLTVQKTRGWGLPVAAHTSSSLSPRLKVMSPGKRVKVGRVWMERESWRTALPAEFTAVQE